MKCGPCFLLLATTLLKKLFFDRGVTDFWDVISRDFAAISPVVSPLVSFKNNESSTLDLSENIARVWHTARPFPLLFHDYVNGSLDGKALLSSKPLSFSTKQIADANLGWYFWSHHEVLPHDERTTKWQQQGEELSKNKSRHPNVDVTMLLLCSMSSFSVTPQIQLWQCMPYACRGLSNILPRRVSQLLIDY